MFQLLLSFKQRCAVIRKRDRDEPSASQPALDPTKDKCISQRILGSGGGKSADRIAVCPVKGGEPLRAMKDRRRRMVFEKLLPPMVG